MHDTTRRHTLRLCAALALAGAAFAACTDGNKANQAKGDVREAGGGAANDSAAAGYAAPGTGGAASDTLRPNGAQGATGGAGTQPTVAPGTGTAATSAPAATTKRP